MDEPCAPIAIDTSRGITTVEIRTPKNSITLDQFLDCWFATPTRAYLESVWEELNQGGVSLQKGGSRPATHE